MLRLMVAIVAALIASCYADWSWKECKLINGDVLLNNDRGFDDCTSYCAFMYDETDAQGYCKAYPSGYFCQCRFDAVKDTQQSCKNVEISKVVENSDRLDTCEAWCRESQKTNTGTCLSYLTGYYCNCH